MTPPRPSDNTDIRARKQTPFCVSEQKGVTCVVMTEHDVGCRLARKAIISPSSDIWLVGQASSMVDCKSRKRLLRVIDCEPRRF